MNENLEPLRPVISRLAGLMKKEHPDAVPFDDRQEWPWPAIEAALPGTWAFTLGMDTGGRNSEGFKALQGVGGLSVRTIYFSGPARAFLTGWNAKGGYPVVVSTPLFEGEEVARELLEAV